ncbi:MAG: TonB-dependent receptor [Acidobacteriaceae bacterium]|nr:TonB-dependent receptor [Acidobacteriaceae bacterium]
MKKSVALFQFWLLLFLSGRLVCQAQSNNGTIRGTVLDPSGAAVVGASVEIQNPVSGYNKIIQTDAKGSFQFDNVPFNPYHLTAQAEGFRTAAGDIDVRSQVPIDINLNLKLGTSTTETTVVAGTDLLETDATPHTDVDRALFNKLPLESASSNLSSLVTLSTPGVAADSNGLFHGMGDHASNSFSLDGQPITDQQSKVFSNQIPIDAVQSLEVIEGIPPAEYGGKTSLIIDVTTRSGQGVTTPHGDVSASYGTFGTSAEAFHLAYGGQKWGNFIALNGLNTGRFLDPPEFTVLHAKGNEENIFDRADYQFSEKDSVHFDMNFTRSWFQNPNTYDQAYHPGLFNPITNLPLGPSDQRSQIKTFDISPNWTHLLSPSTVLNVGAWWRQDQFNYYPSGDPFNDFSPDLQSETVSQSRRLANIGGRASVTYVKGIHNIKAGVEYMSTLLTEGDSVGIVDPGLTASFGCLNPNGTPQPGTPCAILAPYDLTLAGTLFPFYGHTDIKEMGLYVQDSIHLSNWTFLVGIRGDIYRGLASSSQAEPRVGIAYNVKRTNTVLRAGYARTMETPFNENLIIASTGCSIPFFAVLVPPPGVTCNLGPISPGFRNEFVVGIQQAVGRYLVLDGEWINKYTHNAFDFGVVGATPIYFPIEWSRSKIPAYTGRATIPNFHGLTAQIVMSSVAARFFLPQVAGLPIIPPANGVFRIDHDEVFNQTTHLQYQPFKNGPWISFNYRYDSGLVAGAVPCVALTATCFFSTPISEGGAANIAAGQVALVNAITGSPLTADQEYQSGLLCNGRPAAPNPLGPALATCDAKGLTSKYVSVPRPGTENDDHNPQRIQPRNLFDLAVGDDNLFGGDKYRWSARIEVVNLTNQVALYNFLSTFSGTHYVTPRTITGTIGFNF